MNDTYRILRRLGKGGTSNVYLGYHNNLKKYIVIKQLKGENAGEVFNQVEVDALKELRHQYLPRVYDYLKVYNEKTKRYDVYTVMDYVDGADLHDCLRSGVRFTEEMLLRYLGQMAEVLEYMHGKDKPVYHCDIKPDNIMIDRSGNAILIDFNMAVGANQNNILGLTVPYASPEQCKLAQGMGGDLQLDGRTDLYSLGATFYALISGISPRVNEPSEPLHKMGIEGYSKEFLRLIDRLMVFDRDKRLKSAKKLRAAIVNLEPGRRKYVFYRCVSVLASAALVSFGLFFLIRGTKMKPVEAYRDAYTAVVASIQRGDLEMAEDGCMQIARSGQLQDYLRGRTDEQARFYHAMGDVCYFREDFGTAAAYYSHAVELCGTCTGQEQLTFIRDAAISFAQYGDLSMAKAYLQTAKGLQFDGGDLELIDIVIAARSGEVGECLKKAAQLLGSSYDPQLCLRAALTAASVCENPSQKISWLQAAATYDTGKTARRGLAMAWAEKSWTDQDATARREAEIQSLELYRQLCADPYASAADRINYSAMLHQNGQADQAVLELKTALQYEPENYRVLTHLGLMYYELGNTAEAGQYCAEALRLWSADTSAQRLEEGSEEIQNLMEISRRLGVGGNT